MNDNFFTSTEAAAITGCSRRQLQYWREKGIVIPTVATTGRGRNVYYSLPDLLALAVMEYLLTIGLSFEVCRNALDLLRSKEAWFFDQVIEQTPMKWLMFLPMSTKESDLDVTEFDQQAALEALCQGRPVVPFKTDWVRSRLYENLKNFRQSSSIQCSSA